MLRRGDGRRALEELLPLGFLLAQVLFFHRRVLFSSSRYIPWDLREYHQPLAEFMARCLRNGELPLWDPYTYCGFPFYANPQTQFSYPPAWLPITLSNLIGGRRLLGFLEWQIALHVFLGGALAYCLLRRIGLSRPASTLGATSFQLGGYFASQAQHLGAMNAGAWLPLAWLGVIALREGFTWRRLGTLAFPLAMAELAGFPAVTVVVFASSLLLAASLVLLRRAPVKLLGWCALGCLGAAWLSAFQWLPAMELVRRSTAPQRGAWFGTGGGVPLQGLVSLLVPNYYNIFDLSKYSLPWNPTFLYLYCGLAGAALAATALIFSRNRYRGVFALVTLLSALWMLGESTPVGRTLFPLLPTAVKSPLYAEFAMLSFQLGVACLAALGAQQFGQAIAQSDRQRRSRACVVLLAAFNAVDLTVAGSGRPMNTANRSDDPGVTASAFEGSRETLERVRAFVRRTMPPARLENYKDSMRWAGSAALLEVPTANGNDPLALKRILLVRRAFAEGQPWMRYYELAALDSPVLDLLNIRYIISYAPTGAPALRHPKFFRVADLPGHQLNENRNALPRFFLVNRVRKARDETEAAALLRSPEFEPRETAIVEADVRMPGASAVGRPGDVRVVAYGHREVVLETDSSAAAYLVSSETFYPGWRAWLDGRPAKLLLTNVAFRGMPVPAGRHRVEMRFQPRILWASIALSVPAWTILAVAYCRIGGHIRRRKVLARPEGAACENFSR